MFKRLRQRPKLDFRSLATNITVTKLSIANIDLIALKTSEENTQKLEARHLENTLIVLVSVRKTKRRKTSQLLRLS